MNGSIKLLLGFGLLAIAPVSFAQTYHMDLTGVGNGTVADGVYVSPYQGTVSGPGVNYSGYLICDDFNTESYLDSPWTATLRAASALDGSEKFNSSVVFNGTTYSAQQAYNAAGWLANGLLANIDNPINQTNYSFAIWDVFDGQRANPDGGSISLMEEAFYAVTHNNYVASNVSVFTPNPLNSSQEFLSVHAAPEIDAGSASSGITLLLGGMLVLRALQKSRV